MSYDIGIADEDFNYTGNLARFFHDFIERPHGEPENRTGWQTLDGCKGNEVALVLKQALNKISTYRFTEDHMSLINGTPLHFRLGKKYDPDNYWGDVMSASVLMARVMAACYENPDGTFSVWA